MNDIKLAELKAYRKAYDLVWSKFEGCKLEEMVSKLGEATRAIQAEINKLEDEIAN